jgi:DnaK suppressor protein
MVTEATTITAAELKRRRTTLELKLREVLGISRERGELRIEYMADPLDQLRSSADREITVQRLDHKAHLVHDVQSAISKVDKGTYGLCERCEAPIPRKRLDAVPWALLCVRCQSEAEAADRGGKPWIENAA